MASYLLAVVSNERLNGWEFESRIWQSKFVCNIAVHMGLPAPVHIWYEVGAGMSDYIPTCYVGVITYPSQNIKTEEDIKVDICICTSHHRNVSGDF